MQCSGHREVWEQWLATWALLKRRMKGDYRDYNKGNPTQSNQTPAICLPLFLPSVLSVPWYSGRLEVRQINCRIFESAVV